MGMDPDDPTADIPSPDLPTEADAFDAAIGEITGLIGQAETFLTSLLRPWNAYQVGIAVAILLAAYLLKRLFGPRIRAWMASRKDWPTWRMRILVVIHRRLFMIFFVLLIWTVFFVMREVTWPSRSFLLAIVAELATAWLFVVFATRLIRSPLLRGIVRYGAWTYVTLAILNLRDEAAVVLDSVGFNLGDARLSLLTLLQAVAVVAALIVIARFLTSTATGRIQKNEEMSPSMQVLAVKFLQVAFYGIAIYVGLHATGIDLTGLAVLSGAIGVGLGFGLQKVVSNLVSGVIILLDKSIKPGDVISLGETFGWINSLGYALIAASDRPQKDFTFFMIRSRDINAFATLGGYVAVNAGLVLTAENQDEVAAVLGHEISHVTQRHIVRAVEAAQKDQLPIMLAMLAGIVIGATGNGDAVQAAVAGGTGLMQQRQINFTRGGEQEADRIGIQLLARAGFNPEAMANFFSRMQLATRSGDAGPPEFLRTHPVTTNRIAEARDRAERIVGEELANAFNFTGDDVRAQNPLLSR